MSEMSFDAIREGAKMAVEQGVAEGIAAAMAKFGAESKVPEPGFYAAQAANERRARKAAPRKPGPAKRVAASLSGRKGAKRAPEDMQALTDRLLQCITNYPSQSAEEIAKACGTTTKEQALPIRKLIANGKVKTEGVKRATRYFPR